MAIITLNKLALPTGSILQVQSTFYNTTFTQSISANTDTEISNISVNITPSSTSNKIMIFGRLFSEYSEGSAYNSGYFFRRGSTKIGEGVALGSRSIVMATHGTNYISSGGYDAGSTPETINMFHIDSPSSVSQQTYTIGYRAESAGTLYVNRTVLDTNSTSRERGSSEIIVMEIKG
tara:strand:+ start:528 stop:1058 length:531 start_codon:yes stop_codon:yes gene_type:complete